MAGSWDMYPDAAIEAFLLGPNPFCDEPYAKGEETWYCRQDPGHEGDCGPAVS